MRRRRAIVYDDDPLILDMLALLFEGRGYDVLAFSEPLPCAIYDSCPRCDRERPCADIVTTDLVMPVMNGIELLEVQAQRGCPLTPRNKAVISGSLDFGALAAIRRLGCAWFEKPFRIAQFEEWVRECELRMDLSRPLAILRKERRDASPERHVTVCLEDGECAAEVVNKSPSGMCLRLDRQLAVAQVLDVRSRPADPPERLVVRWTKPAVDGDFLAGTSSV